MEVRGNGVSGAVPPSIRTGSPAAETAALQGSVHQTERGEAPGDTGETCQETALSGGSAVMRSVPSDASAPMRRAPEAKTAVMA